MNTGQLGSNAEKVLVVFKNVDAATVSTGLGVALINSGASTDGIQSVKQPATTYSKTFYGISTRDIPVNGFGAAVVWGLADSIALSAVGTSITVTAGDQLWPSSVAGYFFSSSANDVKVVNAALSALTAAALFQNTKNWLTAVDSITVSAQAYVRGIVRAL